MRTKINKRLKTLTQEQTKWLRSLKQKKYRTAEKCYFIEGKKMLEEALENVSEDILMIVTTDDSILAETFQNFEVYKCSAKQMQQFSELKTPSAYFTVIKKKTDGLPKINQKFIVLDGIQDPGNLGTIIRTCDWFGIEHIVCSNDTVEHHNPKVIQATMGSIFRVQVSYVDLQDFIKLSKAKIVGTEMAAPSLFDSMQILKEATGIVIGNEGKGISQEVRDLIPNHISIPKNGNSESLNAAVSAGIIMSHWTLK